MSSQAKEDIENALQVEGKLKKSASQLIFGEGGDGGGIRITFKVQWFFCGLTIATVDLFDSGINYSPCNFL